MGWELTSGSPEGPRVVGLGDGLLSIPGKEEMALVEEAISAAHRGVFFFFLYVISPFLERYFSTDLVRKG